MFARIYFEKKHSSIDVLSVVIWDINTGNRMKSDKMVKGLCISESCCNSLGELLVQCMVLTKGIENDNGCCCR